MAVKVMIADDHSMIREGLKQLLELEGDFEVIAEACDGVDCLEKLKTVVPDILLLDIGSPSENERYENESQGVGINGTQ